MFQKLTLLFLFISLMKMASAQTTISGGNVSGTWTKANSPYKINGNIVVPNGSTLTIEPGVSIQFAQFKYMNVDGRIIAIGGSKATDSIWFTKQNPSDTGSWKGVKFIKTATTNDTSIFKYCVFRNCKSIYDTALATISGGITLVGYGKLNISNSIFYKNEASIGSCLYLTRGSYAKITACEFKYNASCEFLFWDGSFNRVAGARGSAIALELNSNPLIDSCRFTNNRRGIDYSPYHSILYDASTIDVRGNGSKQISINNSIFDGNEGIMVYAYSSKVNLNNCRFVNAPKGKSLEVVYSGFGDIKMNQCTMTSNQSDVLLKAESGNILFDKGLINLNTNFISTYSGSSPSLNVQNSKIINNYGGLNATDNSITGSFKAHTVLNCLIANNYIGVPVICNYLYNSTIVNNRSAKLCVYGSNLTCKNCIIWGNVCDSFPGKQISNLVNTTNTYNNCLIEGDTSAFAWSRYVYKLKKPDVYKNNIASNPQFVSPTAGAGLGFNAALADFSVKNTCSFSSPVINAGASDILYMMPATDLNGNPRFYEENLDIGCYENISGVPTISILKQTKNDTLCEKSRNGELSLLAIGKTISYQWQKSTDGGASWGNINGQTSTKLSLSATTQSQNGILYRALLSGACDLDTSASAMIITNPSPIFNLGKDTAVCKNASIAKSVATTGAYLWHTNNTTNAINQKITKDTAWWLQITNAQGCKYRDTVKITSNPLPVVNLGTDQSIDRLKQITLDAGAGQSKYLWSDGTKLQTKTFIGQDLGPVGKYTLWAEVTNSNGCTSRDSIQITVTDNSGINGVALGSISIYPQPANHFLNINIPPSLNSGSLHVNITTIEGKLVTNQTLESTINSIAVSQLEVGIYLITIFDASNNASITLKFVKG